MSSITYIDDYLNRITVVEPCGKAHSVLKKDLVNLVMGRVGAEDISDFEGVMRGIINHWLATLDGEDEQ